MINKDNYIEYIVDYFDGNLSDNQQESLLLFLGENPEYKDEFDNYSEAIEDGVLSEAIETPKSLKDTLKSIPETHAQANNEKLVAYMENDLSAAERKEVEKSLVENSEMQRSLYLLEKTRFEADMDVVFPHKSALKRYLIPPFVKRTVIAVTSAAAILLLFYNIIGTSNTNQSNPQLVSQMSIMTPFSNHLNFALSVNDSDDPDTTKTNNNNVIVTPGNQEPEIIQGIPLIASAEQVPVEEIAPQSINDVRTEYLEIYAYTKYKINANNPDAEEKKESKLGTFAEWTAWARQTVSGEKSIKDNPANQLTASDISNFGISTLSRIAGTNIPLAIK